MEKIICSSPETAPVDNLTILKRLNYNSKRSAYYASNYGAILNLQSKGKMSVLGVQKNKSVKERPSAARHGADKRPFKCINSHGSPLHNKQVPRLVAEAFLGEKAIKGKQIHHLNGNPACNRADNIIAVTPKEHAQIHKQIRSGQIVITNLQKAKFYVTQ